MSLNKTFSGDVVNTGGGTATTIQPGVVSLAKQADLAQGVVVGRALSSGTGTPTALTAAQVAAIVSSVPWTEIEESGAGPHNDFDPLGSPAHIMASNAAGVFTGVVSPGVVGHYVLFSHQGTGYTELQHNTTSATANRFFNGRLGKDLRIFDNEMALYQRVDTVAGGTTTIRWQLLTPTFPFAHANDSAAGDIIAHNGTNYVVVSGGNSTDVVLRGNATFGSVALSALASQPESTIILRAVSAGTGVPIAGTGSQAGAIIRDVAPISLAVVTSNIAIPFIIGPIALTATGSDADDVTVYSANAPFAFRIMRMRPIVTTGALLGTLQGRNATGGGGAAVSSTFGAGSANDSPVITADFGLTATIAANGTLVIRRANGNVEGEVFFECVRI